MAYYQVGRSEDEIGEKVDRCVSDTIVKAGAGAALGVVFSVLLFKRKAWPISFGIGTGFGMALSNCQHEFKKIYPVRTQYTIAKNEKDEAKESSPLNETAHLEQLKEQETTSN